MPQLETLAKVEDVLQAQAVALGLRVAEVRARYPARHVRRAVIIACLRHLEDQGLVAWHHERVRWRGPLRPDARPLGVDLRRLERDLACSPQERVQLMVELSDALAHRRGR